MDNNLKQIVPGILCTVIAIINKSILFQLSYFAFLSAACFPSLCSFDSIWYSKTISGFSGAFLRFRILSWIESVNETASFSGSALISVNPLFDEIFPCDSSSLTIDVTVFSSFLCWSLWCWLCCWCIAKATAGFSVTFWRICYIQSL